MKERALVILLMLSLILNVYFIFFNTALVEGQFEGLSRPVANLSEYNISVDMNSSTGLAATRITPTPEIRIATTIPTTEPTAEPTIPPTPEPTPDPNLWKNYTNSKYRFSVTYPPAWELIEKTSGSSKTVVVINTPSLQECNPFTGECFVHIASFSVEVDPSPDPAVLEDYFNKAVSKLQQQYAITSTSKSAPTILADNKAYEIDYFTKDSRGNRDKIYVQYYSMIDDRVYILTYSGTFSTNEDSVFETNKPDAQKIIDSFEVERVYKVV
jgi:hypothetical protein